MSKRVRTVAKNLFVTSEMIHRKCPVTRKRCMAECCALWADKGRRFIHGGGYDGGSYRVGCCTLGRNR